MKNEKLHATTCDEPREMNVFDETYSSAEIDETCAEIDETCAEIDETCPSAELMSDALKEKAAAVSRSRMPNLSAAGLNFEKRTGNFFRATLKKEDDGTEKMTRTVVPDEELPAETQEEVAAKRAAACVLLFEKNLAKIEETITAARRYLTHRIIEKNEIISQAVEAMQVVEAWELPEKAARVSAVSAKLSEAEERAAAAEAAAERLRAALVAAGLDPDAI